MYLIENMVCFDYKHLWKLYKEVPVLCFKNYEEHRNNLCT